MSKIFADISFYQGNVNFDVMRTKSDRVIIRAGQNTWPDIRFITNWAEAKRVGMKRGCYWFFDGRASPGAQAALLVSFIQDDLPELEIWIDWERNYGGAHEGLRNVVAMMQEVERLLPGVEVGIYTGYYWLIENSNPITHRSQYAYLKTKKLWLAFYAALEDVLIPFPWLFMTYWQKGTPAVGHAWGVETIEIDMNEDMSGEPGPTPEPPPEPPIGGTMKGTVKIGYTLKVRNAQGVDTGLKLFVGDTVYGEEVDNRIYYHRIYRVDETVFILGFLGNSAVRDGSTEWMTLTPEAEPTPDPAPGLPVLNVTVSGEGYQEVSIELRPRT